MNDDLNLLVTYITFHLDLMKVAIHIPGGMNHRYWGEHYNLYGEKDVLEAYKKLLPNHISYGMNKIVSVETIGDVITTNFEDKGASEPVIVDKGIWCWFWATDDRGVTEWTGVPILLPYSHIDEKGYYVPGIDIGMTFERCEVFVGTLPPCVSEYADEYSMFGWSPAKGEYAWFWVEKTADYVIHRVPMLLKAESVVQGKGALVEEFDRFFPSAWAQFTGEYPSIIREKIEKSL